MSRSDDLGDQPPADRRRPSNQDVLSAVQSAELAVHDVRTSMQRVELSVDKRLTAIEGELRSTYVRNDVYLEAGKRTDDRLDRLQRDIDELRVLIQHAAQTWERRTDAEVAKREQSIDAINSRLSTNFRLALTGVVFPILVAIVVALAVGAIKH